MHSEDVTNELFSSNGEGSTYMAFSSALQTAFISPSPSLLLYMDVVGGADLLFPCDCIGVNLRLLDENESSCSYIGIKSFNISHTQLSIISISL